MDSAVNRHRTGWTIVGVLVAAFATFVLYAFFGALVVGVFLYYATRPVYRWVEDRLDRPDVSATITLMTVGLPILLVLGYAALLGIREVDQFLVTTDLEELRGLLEPYVGIGRNTDGQELLDLLRGNLGRVQEIATAIFTWLLRLFVILVFAFYLLRDDHKIARWFRRSFENQPTAVTFMEHVDADLTTIYTGNLLTIGITGLIAVVVYSGLNAVAPPGTGVGFPVLLGLVTGVATLIPAIGMKLVYFPYTGYLAWQSVSGGAVWFPVAFFVVTLVAVDTVPDVFVRSYLSKGDLNMGLMLLTYVLGAAAFGWYGVFFAPAVLVFVTHFAREVLPALLGSESGGS